MSAVYQQLGHLLSVIGSGLGKVK